MAGIRAFATVSRVISWHSSTNYCAVQRCKVLQRGVSFTCCRNGLEEFFPPGVLDSGKLAPEEVRTGRRWHASDLRLKSSSDLHKLWYVLLKEMNMLQTLKQEAKRLQVPMPSPERIKKVQKGMAMIKVVMSERERAVRELEELGYQPMTVEETNGENVASKNTQDLNGDKIENISATSSKDNVTGSEHSKLSIT